VRQGIQTLLELVDDIDVVSEARDGDEALRVIPQSKPDVVLLDMYLPKRNGLEVLRELKKSEFLPPTLILTTFDEDKFVLGGLQAGAKGYLLKDVSLDQLTNAIRTSRVAARWYIPLSRSACWTTSTGFNAISPAPMYLNP
jgi:DNA-binding NarL/FixJ family response regulator